MGLELQPLDEEPELNRTGSGSTSSFPQTSQSIDFATMRSDVDLIDKKLFEMSTGLRSSLPKGAESGSFKKKKTFDFP